MPTYLGVGVNFGVSGTTITISAVGTFKLQSIDHNKKAKVEDVADGDGATVQRTVYDPSDEATFEYVVSADTTAHAVSASTLPVIGALGSVGDSADATIAKTNWIVDDVSMKRSNTGAARVTLKLIAFPGITAVTSA